MKGIKEKPKMTEPKAPDKTLRMPRVISGIPIRAEEYSGQGEEEPQSAIDSAEQKTAEYGKEAAHQVYASAKDTVHSIREKIKDAKETEAKNEIQYADDEPGTEKTETAQRYTPEQIKRQLQNRREPITEPETEHALQNNLLTGRPQLEQAKPERKPVPVQNRTARFSPKTTGSITGPQAGQKTAIPVKQVPKQTIKTAEHTVKTAKKTVKTAKATAKTAEKSAKASVQAAQRAKEAAVRTAQASVKTAQAVAKAIAAAVKAIIAGVKELISAIAAGGGVAAVIIILCMVVAVSLSLCFGIFGSNETAEGQPMTEAIQSINSEFKSSISKRIDSYKREYEPDETILVYEGDADSDGSVMNWADVLGIYAVEMTTGGEKPTDVLMITEDKIDRLKEIFYQMNAVSYETELETKEIPLLDEEGMPATDEEGNELFDTKTTLTITITVSCMDYREGASLYEFDQDQKEQLYEIMRPEYYPMFALLTGDVIGSGGEYGFGLDINPDLPPNELGYQIVQAAKRYIGRSYSSMDCSTLARTAYADCGLTSMKGLSSVRMAQKCLEMGCLFTDASQLQAGDLIFFASFDPSRGPDYCNDRKRCGEGKCRRWMHIHHVAIYINSEYLIDSTGGDNSVQIRKHWGMDTKTTKWVCFGRPTT